MDLGEAETVVALDLRSLKANIVLQRSRLTGGVRRVAESLCGYGVCHKQRVFVFIGLMQV